MLFIGAPKLFNRSNYFSNDNGTYSNLFSFYRLAGAACWKLVLQLLWFCNCFEALFLQSASSMWRRYSPRLHATFRMDSIFFPWLRIFHVSEYCIEHVKSMANQWSRCLEGCAWCSRVKWSCDGRRALQCGPLGEAEIMTVICPQAHEMKWALQSVCWPSKWLIIAFIDSTTMYVGLKSRSTLFKAKLRTYLVLYYFTS